MPGAVFVPAALNDLSVSVSLTAEAQGDLFYRAAARWTNLPAGSSGQFLKTLGPGANPVWSGLAPADLAPAVILAPAATARNVIQPTGAAVLPLAVKGFASQSANLQEWQRSDASVVAQISPAAVTNTTTVGQKDARLTLLNNSFTVNGGSELVFGTLDTAIGRYTALGTDIQANSAGGGAGDFYIANKQFAPDTVLIRRLIIKRDGSVTMGDGTAPANLTVNSSNTAIFKFQEATVDKWQLYRIGFGDEALYFRDLVNSRTQLQLVPSTSDDLATAGFHCRVGAGTMAPTGQLHALTTVAATRALVLQGIASQSGALLALQGRSSTTDGRDMATLDAVWADSADATRKGRGILAAADFTPANRECFRWESSGTVAKIGFFGGAAVVQPAGASAAGIAAITDANARAALQALQTALAALTLVTAPA